MEHVFKKIRTIEESREITRLSASYDDSPNARSKQKMLKDNSAISAAVSAGSAGSAEQNDTAGDAEECTTPHLDQVN